MLRRFSALILLSALLVGAIVPAASAEPLPPSPKGKVVQLLVVGENGHSRIYKGFQAQSMYSRMLDNATISETTTNDDTVDMEEDVYGEGISDEVMPTGMYTGYKYRWVEKSRSLVHGPSKIATDFLYNYSSVPQSYSINVYGSESWSLDTKLEGKFLDAFNAAFAFGWKKAESFSITLSVTVAPRKIAYVAYRPLQTKVSGEVQKCFKKRYSGKLRVVKRIPTSTRSPLFEEIDVLGKRVRAARGSYAWMELPIQ